jgi:RNA polymerase sigma factor (sigma-70 family)
MLNTGTSLGGISSVGRESGVAELTPTLQQRDVETGPTDHQLVAAVRRGDDRAFEALYHRYHRRIQAYVYGMCKDHARAEDITQEIFVSALRRMRETERPIAFKPWVYEIAKNACIDQHRRARRAEEVSLQSEDGLAPADYGRLVNGDPTPDVAVTVKQDLDNLCGAFGGLSDTHHSILVMRELEGLSYREIGERLGMSRPAVESTLFRARRRLTEEYGELVSGARCLRIQGIIATAGRGRLGARDTTRLSRHVAHCQPCRREALAAGLDAAVLRKPLRSRVAAKVAAWLPFPVLGRRFGGTRGTRGAASGVSSGWMAHVPMISDQFGAGWTKAAAAVVVLLAGVGAGVGSKAASDSGHPAARASAARAQDKGVPGGGGGAAAPAALVTPNARAVVRGDGARRAKATPGSAATVRGTTSRGASSTTPSTSSRSTAPARSPVQKVAKPVASKPKTPSTPSTPSGGVTGGAPKAPAAVPTPSQVVSGVNQVVGGAAQGVNGAVQGVNGVINGTTQSVGQVGQAAGDTAGSVTQGVDDAVGQLGSGLSG